MIELIRNAFLILCKFVAQVLSAFKFPTFFINTETKGCLPAECSRLIGVGDELIGINEFQMVGFTVKNVAALIRQIAKEKPGEPVRLGFRRHRDSTSHITGGVYRTEACKGDGKETLEKQNDLATTSGSKHPGAYNVVSTHAPSLPRQGVGSSDDGDALSDGPKEYEAMMIPDEKFGIGLSLKSYNAGKVTVSGFRGHPGE